MPLDVLCIGHAAYDLSFFLPEFPLENSKAEAHQWAENCGGPAANAAWLLSHWGLRTGFCGLVGQDSFGQAIRDAFVAAGTDVQGLELRKCHPTPLSTILIHSETGSRTIVNRKAAGVTLSTDAVQLPAEAPRMLHFDGHELEASLAAMAQFPQAKTMLDAGSVRPGTLELAGRVQCLAASERFALQATGMSRVETAAEQRDCLQRLRDRFGPRQMIVTLGERGLIHDEAGNGHCQHLPAYAMTAVDTTAAGDLFHGALAYALVTGMNWLPALQLASYAAALSVTRPGGRSSAPMLEEVKRGYLLLP
jgi:sulfofructose kinase